LVHRNDRIGRGEIDAAMFGSLERGGGEGAGVDAALLQVKSGMIEIGKRWFEFGEGCRKRVLGLRSWMRNVCGGREENRALIAQVDFHAGFDLQFAREFGIHAGAGRGEWL
jgi:hypothetical protein